MVCITNDLDVLKNAHNEAEGQQWPRRCGHVANAQ